MTQELTRAELLAMVDKLIQQNTRLRERLRYIQRRLDREMQDAMEARQSLRNREQRQAQIIETHEMLWGKV